MNDLIIRGMNLEDGTVPDLAPVDIKKLQEVGIGVTSARRSSFLWSRQNKSIARSGSDFGQGARIWEASCDGPVNIWRLVLRICRT